MIRSDRYSEIGWILIALISIVIEGYLYFFRNHTLSEQMRYWIQNAKLGSPLVLFWGWLLYHFTVEPIIRAVLKLMNRG